MESTEELDTPRFVAPGPESFEIRITDNAGFTVDYGKLVKAIDGYYTHCHGKRDYRLVTLPNTYDGREMANNIINEFGLPMTTVTMQDTGLRSSPQLTVQEVFKTDDRPIQLALARYNVAFEKAVAISTRLVGPLQELRRLSDGRYVVQDKVKAILEVVTEPMILASAKGPNPAALQVLYNALKVVQFAAMPHADPQATKQIQDALKLAEEGRDFG